MAVETKKAPEKEVPKTVEQSAPQPVPQTVQVPQMAMYKLYKFKKTRGTIGGVKVLMAKGRFANDFEAREAAREILASTLDKKIVVEKVA